jgi:hypothetical protein
MLALEDGPTLRLLAGIDDQEMAAREPFKISNTPTRFGRVSLALEPRRGNAWQLKFDRAAGHAPSSVELPESLGGLALADIKGARFTRGQGRVRVDAASRSWEALWKS